MLLFSLLDKELLLELLRWYKAVLLLLL